MRELINPADLASSPNYSQGVLVRDAKRWLSIAGQVGRDRDGVIPDGVEAQADLVWRNIAAVLREAGMSMHDLVEITVYLVAREDNAAFDAARAKWLAGARPASTKLFVSGLADPRLRCEVSATAAAD